MYADYGSLTCGGYPGVLNHQETDANTFAQWGVDQVKLDGCYVDVASMDTGLIPSYSYEGIIILISINQFNLTVDWFELVTHYEYPRKSILLFPIKQLNKSRKRIWDESDGHSIYLLRDYDSKFVMLHLGYPEFGRLLNATGHPMVYSCSWPAYQENVCVIKRYLIQNVSDWFDRISSPITKP